MIVCCPFLCVWDPSVCLFVCFSFSTSVLDVFPVTNWFPEWCGFEGVFVLRKSSYWWNCWVLGSHTSYLIQSFFEHMYIAILSQSFDSSEGESFRCASLGSESSYCQKVSVSLRASLGDTFWVHLAPEWNSVRIFLLLCYMLKKPSKFWGVSFLSASDT
jgi:hypothetical protein